MIGVDDLSAMQREMAQKDVQLASMREQLSADGGGQSGDPDLVEQAQANYAGLANHPTASELASAQAQVDQAKASLASLLDNPKESDLVSAQSQIAQAEASLNSLLERPNPEDVAVQQAQVEEATVALAQAESQFDDATITAPFAGSILAVQVHEGEWASPGTPAIR